MHAFAALRNVVRLVESGTGAGIQSRSFFATNFAATPNVRSPAPQRARFSTFKEGRCPHRRLYNCAAQPPLLHQFPVIPNAEPNHATDLAGDLAVFAVVIKLRENCPVAGPCQAVLGVVGVGPPFVLRQVPVEVVRRSDISFDL